MTPAEVIEKALREHLRLRLGKRALTDAMLDKPIMLSGGEAEEAARIAVEAIAAELRAEGQRERGRLHDRLDNVAIHNWVTAWDFAARFVEGDPPQGRLIIHNQPAALPERTDTP